MSRIALVLVCLMLLGGCGGHASTVRKLPTPPVSDRAIPGAPDTPRWLRIEIWRIVGGLGDLRPAKIAVNLNVREHGGHGRIVDRVWMRGHFTCDGCVWTGTVHLRLVGYTFDARTHDTLSSSGHGGR